MMYNFHTENFQLTECQINHEYGDMNTKGNPIALEKYTIREASPKLIGSSIFKIMDGWHFYNNIPVY